MHAWPPTNHRDFEIEQSREHVCDENIVLSLEIGTNACNESNDERHEVNG